MNLPLFCKRFLDLALLLSAARSSSASSNSVPTLPFLTECLMDLMNPPNLKQNKTERNNKQSGK